MSIIPSRIDPISKLHITNLKIHKLGISFDCYLKENNQRDIATLFHVFTQKHSFHQFLTVHVKRPNKCLSLI